MMEVETLRLMGISQVLLLGMGALCFQRQLYIGKLLAFFALCMACYLAFPLLDLSQNKLASFLIGRLAFATPAVLWLIAYAFFIDCPRIPKTVWICIAAYMILRATGSIYFYVIPEHPRLSIEFISFYMIPSVLGIGMCAHMIYLALSGYDNDLVEIRRRIRVHFVLILGGLFTLMTISSLLVLARQMSESFPLSSTELQWIISLCIFPVTLAVNLLLLRLNFENIRIPAFLESHASNRSAYEELDDKDMAIKKRILTAMEQDKLYRQTGLTIGDFAKHLNIQEYKLRTIINRHLKYNNFSHFLNGYRIHEAEHRLLTTKDPIFNIGLDVGYTSLSSFHKAFRESHRMTPREFRVLHRGEAKNFPGKLSVQ
ncbi:MAG: helix-turn-helix transcriptional regulator [Pseudohongiella sp.]|nr:helix-turn-helix transcriptional regulator [Pseudohongiella sp.]